MSPLDAILRGVGADPPGRQLHYDVLVDGAWVGPVTPDDIHQRPELHNADRIRVAQSVTFT